MVLPKMKILPQLAMKPLHLRRFYAVIAKSVRFDKFGEPADVLRICEEELEEPTGKQVLVKILAAPINPADINIIQGKYPIKVTFPATGGNEGVAEVVAIGDKVKKICPGQQVIPFASGLGTWATHAIFEEDILYPLPCKIGVVEAATISVNPCTAYRMLKDFVHLEKGDCVIQNGANSAVGQAVHQLCRAWGFKSVGIVRDRKEIAQLKDYLKSLGASEVLTEEELRVTTIFKDGEINKPKLALNCVGGKSASELTRHLDRKGAIVTYGGMSRKPVLVGTAQLIFKQVVFHGFWMTRWSKENANSPARLEMFEDLCKLVKNGDFVGPVHKMLPLDEFHKHPDAFEFKGFAGKKFIFDMHSE